MHQADSGSPKVTKGAQKCEHGCDKEEKRDRKTPRKTSMSAGSKDEALWCEDTAWDFGHVSRRRIPQKRKPRGRRLTGMASKFPCSPIGLATPLLSIWDAEPWSRSLLGTRTRMRKEPNPRLRQHGHEERKPRRSWIAIVMS